MDWRLSRLVAKTEGEGIHDAAIKRAMILEALQVEGMVVNRARPSFLSRPVRGRQGRPAQ